MADVKLTLKYLIMRTLFWTVPHGMFLHGMYHLRNYQRKKNIAKPPPALEQRNERFKDCHKGERCFVLACGPSIKQQDLSMLKDEICIGVNNFFVHKDYALIRPNYHCAPDVLEWHNTTVNEEYAIKWFREMETRLQHTVLFLSHGDKEIIKQSNLFHNKEVYYFHFRYNWENFEDTGVDAASPIPAGKSVAILAIEIALYMGCKQIYLLGCDHNWLLHYGESRHFYAEDENVIVRPELGYTEFEGKGVEEAFRYHIELWTQYKRIQQYAESHEIHIYNATPGSMLDVFPRVRFESLF